MERREKNYIAGSEIEIKVICCFTELMEMPAIDSWHLSFATLEAVRMVSDRGYFFRDLKK